jgi:hypothetical protein
MSETPSPCGATTVVPVLDRTVICELPFGHEPPHHGHIDEGPQTGSQHMQGPTSFDWHDTHRT